MKKSYEKVIKGYKSFREKYVFGENNLLKELAEKGQNPPIILVSCCDSRVDPALLLQCDPGDLFTVRNIANIVPPYEHDGAHHGTSAALEFGLCYLKAKHLIIMGHSQCGGIQALLNKESLTQDDFISNWVDMIELNNKSDDVDCCAQSSLINSYHNALTFPWIKQAIEAGDLQIHLWFFNIQEGAIYAYEHATEQFKPLLVDD